MPVSFGIPTTLSDLGTALASIPNGSNVYIYKNSDGSLNASVAEAPLTTSNFGYQFTFINGDVSYTSIPISSLSSIPWLYPSSTLTSSSANLWNSSLKLWFDAMESKSISTQQQKVMSKDYSTNLLMIENTTDYSFTYSSNTLDLSNHAVIENTDAQTVYQYFKVALTVQIPTFISGRTIFQHNRFSIRLITNADLDSNQSPQVALYDNGTYIKGLNIVAGSTKYTIYADSSSTLMINNAQSNMSNQSTPSYYQATTAKIYIGSDSTKSFPSDIKIHEVLYYCSTANDIAATNSNIMTYEKARWSWTDYSPTGNTPPTSLAIVSPLSGTEASKVTGEEAYYTVTGLTLHYNGSSPNLWYGLFYISQKYYTIGGATGTFFVCVKNVGATAMDGTIQLYLRRKYTDGNFVINSWNDLISSYNNTGIGGRIYNDAGNGTQFLAPTYSSQANPSGYTFQAGWYFVLSIDHTGLQKMRYFDSNQTLVCTFSRSTPDAVNLTYGQDKYYPAIEHVHTTNDIQFQTSFAIAGETNILA